MKPTRRKFTPEEKARLVLEILKEEKFVSHLAAEHGIHANALTRWKTEAVYSASDDIRQSKCFILLPFLALPLSLARRQ
ncbi:transposase [Cohnella pontilimi]|uniref:transposase n=1 Tax=Cohnella pontilimi TaxID=2564100 RepID=UPI003CCC4798